MSDAQPQAEIPQPEQSDTIACEDLDSFVRMLTHWHTNAVARVNHLLNMPVGAVMQVGDEADQTEIVMIPTTLAGFKLGVELAMSNLGKLPFLVELEQDEDEEAAVGG